MKVLIERAWKNNKQKGMILESRKTCAEFERMLVAAKGVCELEIKQVVAFISIFATLCMVFGCVTKSEVVTVPEVRTETDYFNTKQHDSIFVHDSIYLREWMAGDTVYVQHDRWHTHYVKKEVHDTTYIETHDTIPQPYPVEVKVEKPLSWWQATRIHLGEVMLVLLVLIVIIGVVKIAKYIKL